MRKTIPKVRSRAEVGGVRLHVKSTRARLVHMEH